MRFLIYILFLFTTTILSAQKDVKWFKNNDSYIPISCSITTKQESEAFGIKVVVNKGGPYDIIEAGSGWFLTLYVPENHASNAKVEYPILYEHTDFLKVANEYYLSLDADQKAVTYDNLTAFSDYWPKQTSLRKTINVKGNSGKISIPRGEAVTILNVYSEKKMKIAYNDESFEIDPRDTKIVFDIRTNINPEKRYPGNDLIYITMPFGDYSFADQLVSYHFGTHTDKSKVFLPFINDALGPPNRTKDAYNSTITGCKGVLVLAFTDNELIDGPGMDLYIFSDAKRYFGLDLYISENGQEWVELGYLARDVYGIDINGIVEENQSFRYVKLIQNGVCSYGGNFIDAVGAINTRLIQK